MLKIQMNNALINKLEDYIKSGIEWHKITKEVDNNNKEIYNNHRTICVVVVHNESPKYI